MRTYNAQFEVAEEANGSLPSLQEYEQYRVEKEMNRVRLFKEELMMWSQPRGALSLKGAAREGAIGLTENDIQLFDQHNGQ